MPLAPRITTLTVPTLRLEALQAALYASEMTIQKALKYIEGKRAALSGRTDDEALMDRQHLDALKDEREAELAAVLGLMNQIKVLI